MSDYSDRMIIDHTCQEWSRQFFYDFKDAFLSYPETGCLPEEIADLFTVRTFQSEQTGKLHIIVDFAED